MEANKKWRLIYIKWRQYIIQDRGYNTLDGHSQRERISYILDKK